MQSLRGRYVWFLAAVLVLFALFPDAYAYAADPPTPGDDRVAQAWAGVDALWVLLGGSLVVMMQSGFLTLEVGFVREKAAPITSVFIIGNWVVAVVAFFLFGWAIMFGHGFSLTGGTSSLFGTDFFMLGNQAGLLSTGVPSTAIDGQPPFGTPDVAPIGIWVHFAYNLAFAGTAAIIVSGALAERTGFVAYLISTFVLIAIIYPVCGHWVWGNSFFTKNDTLLTHIGFVDFAGSTMIHSIGGWVSLVGIWVVGPRLGRFREDGTIGDMKPSSMTMAALGTMLLWFGWWGFNGASGLVFVSSASGQPLGFNQVGYIIQNTNLGGAFGGLAALVHCAWFQGKRDMTAKFMGGILAGLAAVTASCHLVTPLGAMIIGATAGILCNLATEWLLKWKLDDPVAAIPVHLFGGVWGTLCVGLFGRQELFPNGHDRLTQIGVQLIGIATCAAWVVGVSLITFLILKKYAGLRVSPHEELHGFDLSGAFQAVEEKDTIDTAELEALMK